MIAGTARAQGGLPAHGLPSLRTPWHPAAIADLRAFLHRALDEQEGAPSTVVVYLPAPAAPLETLLRALPMPGCLFAPPAGDGFAGLGYAHHIRLAGPSRFHTLRREAAALFERLVVRVHPATGEVPAPRLAGGFSFAPGSAAGEGWSEFGDGAFGLPRWTYGTHGERFFLAFAGRGRSLDRAAIAAELEIVVETLARAATGRTPRPSDVPRPARVEQLSRTRWTELVESVRDEIGRGRFEKIVAARRALVEVSEPFDDVSVLARLGAAAEGCTRFALREEHATFLGATPERLVARSGRRVRTEALAGSITAARPPSDAAHVSKQSGNEDDGEHGNGSDDERDRPEPAARLLGGQKEDGSDDEQDLAGPAARLLGSRKDLAEHAFVVREIVRLLAPLTASLEVAPEPRVRRLRHVLHLHTPIEGELAAPTHILDLVEALHPTPAVGGLPTREAVEWIARHEPAPRGWYAGPVGWFDAAGDGEFVVALRSGLIAGRRAHIYAGAGIVAASDPAVEYAETELKQRALLGALGVRVTDENASDAAARPPVTSQEPGAGATP